VAISTKNSAYAVGEKIWERYTENKDPQFGVELKLNKYMPIGSGLGSSAASAAAAAKAITTILNFNYDKTDFWNDLCAGELVTAGSGHPDNVIPSYFGGVHFMPSNHGYHFHRKTLKDAVFVFCMPKIGTVDGILTSESRSAVREHLRENYLNQPPDKDVN